MCHKHEMMEHFYSKAGRTHPSLNPAGRADSNIPAEMLLPDDVIIFHDDAMLDEGISRPVLSVTYCCLTQSKMQKTIKSIERRKT